MATFVKYFYPDGLVFVEEVPERKISKRPEGAIGHQFFDREEKEDGQWGPKVNSSELTHYPKETSKLKDLLDRIFE